MTYAQARHIMHVLTLFAAFSSSALLADSGIAAPTVSAVSTTGAVNPTAPVSGTASATPAVGATTTMSKTTKAEPCAKADPCAKDRTRLKKWQTRVVEASKELAQVVAQNQQNMAAANAAVIQAQNNFNAINQEIEAADQKDTKDENNLFSLATQEPPATEAEIKDAEQTLVADRKKLVALQADYHRLGQALNEAIANFNNVKDEAEDNYKHAVEHVEREIEAVEIVLKQLEDCEAEHGSKPK